MRLLNSKNERQLAEFVAHGTAVELAPGPELPLHTQRDPQSMQSDR